MLLYSHALFCCSHVSYFSAALFACILLLCYSHALLVSSVPHGNSTPEYACPQITPAETPQNKLLQQHENNYCNNTEQLLQQHENNYCNNTEQLLQHAIEAATTPNNCCNNMKTTTATCRLKRLKHAAYISSSTTTTSIETYRNIKRAPLQHGEI
jgi:hypothetical protein